MSGIEAAIAERSNYPVNRKALVSTLNKQYNSLNKTKQVEQNLAALADEHTYTICTAHQPNLLTGYLYFIYKIAHAISLAQLLNTKHTDKQFVPVYYIGSEDNDLDELGVFKYNNKKYKWDADGQTGAVGRMDTKSLQPILNELFSVIGPPNEHTEQLKKLLTSAYLEHNTIGAATQYLVNELFGKYGLIVIDADDAAFKHELVDVIEDDLLNHNANSIVSKQAEQLAAIYKSQAYPRDINLFYLKDNIRERIERDGDNWHVLNTDISWSKEELLKELKDHPEHFSPNVILRGVLQERILPNVAFIGGGAEVAYWLQLNKMFKHYNTFFPVVMLRQSALWIEPKAAVLQQKAGLSTEQLFQPTDLLIEEYVKANSASDWTTNGENEAFEDLLKQLQDKAVNIDATLSASAAAALTKIQHQLAVLEKKMLRAEKRKHQTYTDRLYKLKDMLFQNNSLQERTENFIEYYPFYGQAFIDIIVKSIHPVENEFLVVSNS